MADSIKTYIDELDSDYRTGKATERSHRPAQKWLKDRKGRFLSYDDILHYRRIIRVLAETSKITGEVWVV